MPDSGLLVLSFVSLVLGVLLILYPSAIKQLSSALNRTLAVLDEPIVRYRYGVGLLAFIASYAFFKLALLLPTLKG